MIILGIFTHSGDFENLPLRTGTSKTASILSFSSAVFGFAAAWSAVSSDYCVYQPVTVSRKKIFFTVFYGLLPALLFTQLLGLAIATATANNPEYAAAYNDNKVGGLLAHILFPHLGNFGKFCLVVLALSTIGNNIPNIYSLGFSLQILHSQAQRIPRYVWSFVGSLVYIGIAIPGYSHFETVLESFMLIIVCIITPEFVSFVQTTAVPRAYVPHRYRDTGPPFIKASLWENTLCSDGEQGAITSKISTHHRSFPRHSQPLALSVVVSWALPLGCHRYGLLDRFPEG